MYVRMCAGLSRPLVCLLSKSPSIYLSISPLPSPPPTLLPLSSHKGIILRAILTPGRARVCV